MLTDAVILCIEKYDVPSVVNVLFPPLHPIEGHIKIAITKWSSDNRLNPRSEPPATLLA